MLDITLLFRHANTAYETNFSLLDVDFMRKGAGFGLTNLRSVMTTCTSAQC